MARGRPKNKGDTRMDAALEAMECLGFPRRKVERFVKDLLKEYGGSQGWRFIEDDSYLQLIEALLRDAEGNDQENVTGSGNQSKEKLFDNEEAATTSTTVPYTEQDGLENNVAVDVVGPSGVVAELTPRQPVSSPSGTCLEVGENVILLEESWKDILANQTSGDVEKETAKVSSKLLKNPRHNLKEIAQSQLLLKGLMSFLHHLVGVCRAMAGLTAMMKKPLTISYI